MEMYRDSYAMAVIVNGKVLKEMDNTVVMPFGTEYTVRLKNKQRKQSVADVFIDGRLAAKGIVVSANGTVDLERFVVDGNLASGPCFKLVPTKDGRVEQPDEMENGILEVKFYPEKDLPTVKVVEHLNYHNYYQHRCHGHCKQCCWDFHCQLCRPNVKWCSNSGNAFSDNQYQVGTSMDWSMVSMNTASQSLSSRAIEGAQFTNALSTDSEVGATVEGSLSKQAFHTVHVDVDVDHPVTLQLKLRGVAKLLETCSCGFKRRDENFCPKCGTELAIGVAA